MNVIDCSNSNNNNNNSNVMHEMSNIKTACGEEYQTWRSSYADHLNNWKKNCFSYIYKCLIWRCMQQSSFIYRRLRLR